MRNKLKIFLLLALLATAGIASASAADDSSKDSDAAENKGGVVKSYYKELKGSIVEFEWCGTNEIFNDETDRISIDQEMDDSFETRVFVLTDNGNAYKSTTYGKTWINLSEKFSSSGNGDFYATEISVSPVDGTTVFIWGKSTVSYVAEMCGKTWRAIQHPAGLYDFRFHRKNKDWILAYQQKKCEEFDEDCNTHLQTLYVSKDGGASFEKISDNVLEATWNRMNNFYNIESPGILAAIETEGNSRIVYTDDFGQTYNTVQDGGDNFYQADYFLFLTVKPKSNKKSYSLKIATLFDDFRYFIEPKDIKLPFDAKDHLSFTILKSDQSQVFISIHHETEDFKQSNVYVSDWRGYELGLSLLYNVRNEDGSCDFEKISSNEGVFIANTYDSNKVEEMKTLKKRMNSNKRDSSNVVKKNLNVELANFKKSVISYDNGSNWHQLKAPAKKWNGKSHSCSGECSLHLIGRTFGMKGQIYSSGNAPGLIVGIGNVGLHLAQKIVDMNTYLSNDGGHTWLEILSGPHIFEIGDHGGIILAASAVNKTNSIVYSWDEGKTWSKHNLGLTAFEVESITTEPNNMDQRFIISGKSKSNGSSNNAVVVLVDLSELHTRGCVGSDHPDRPNSDYQIWYPTNFKGDKCIFGKKFSYVRRKPESQCFNSIPIEQKTIKEECPCSDEDWECDFGFFRKDNTGDCIPMNPNFNADNLSKPPQDCVWRYSISQGYRKVPGVYCNGGVDKNPAIVDCPPKIAEVQVRKEDDSETFKSYKEEQNKQMDIMRQKWLEAEKKAAESRSQASLITLSWMNTVFVIFIVVGLLGAAFYFKDYISLAISAIGELGNKQRLDERSYKQITRPKNAGSSKDQKSTRIESEDRHYDYEEQENQLEQQEKPVLQRDQENYFEDSYE